MSPEPLGPWLDVVSPATIEPWLELLTKLGLGLTAALVGFVWALYKGIIVWGTYCDAIKKEKDEWKNAALKNTGVLERLVDQVEAKKI